jgi:hypothetical protein
MASALQIVKKFFPEVKSVVDATRDTTIKVTVKDEKASHKLSHKACAMAVACKRTMNLDGVIISIRTAYLIKDKKATRYTLPDSVTREIVSFDRGGGFMPGEYEMRKPRKGQRLGEPGGHNKSRTGTGIKIRRHHFTSGIRTNLTFNAE